MTVVVGKITFTRSEKVQHTEERKKKGALVAHCHLRSTILQRI